MKKTPTNKTKLDWQLQRNLLEKAAEHADSILKTRPANTLPVDPFEIARSEGRRLKLIPDDFKNRFDGQLEYLKKPGKFLILLNNKYDRNVPAGKHHARTRFSLAHELGHLYLEHHVAHLLRGGRPHPSRGEFEHKEVMELEADAFAASLLMPRDAFSEQLNEQDPSLDVIQELATTFQTSTVATLYRAVNLSDFPCAVVCVRDGKVAWTFSSQRLIDAGCYPPERAPLQSKKALEAWNAREEGSADLGTTYAQVRLWFRTYDKDELLSVNVREEYLALPWRRDLLIFLTIDEDELADASGSGDRYDEDDDQFRE